MKIFGCMIIAMIFQLNCLLCVPNTSAKTLYDDFSEDFIESNNWRDQEVVRQVSQGVLVSKVKNSPSAQDVRNNTPIINASSINIITCEISIDVANPDAGGSSEAIARVDGRFYNTQNSGTERGDIWVGLNLGNRGSGLEAWWEVWEATDDNGNEWEEKGSGSLAVPGLTYNQFYNVKIDYDGTNEFIFSVAGVNASFTGPVRQAPEYTPYKALETFVHATGGDGSGYISASFDNVFINDESSVYDDFSTAPLDQTKWGTLELAREIENGHIRLLSHSTGDRKSTSLSFSEIHPYVEATVRVDSSSSIDPGDRGIARIDGYYYNDTHSPGNYNGYEGNVWVGFYLDYQDGVLKAKCSGDRTLDAADTQWENLFYREFNLPIQFDRAYKMAIHFTGARLRFIIKDTVTGRMDVYGYVITTTVHEPYDEYVRFLSRVYGNSTGGFMAAEVDDVYVDVAEPAATFDASGDWELTVSNFWDNNGCGLPDASDTNISIIQSGNDFTLALKDDENTTLDGKVYGDTYSFKGTEADNDETEIVYGIFTLSDISSGTGNVIFIWLDDTNYCESGFGIAITKSSTDVDDDGDDSDGDGDGDDGGGGDGDGDDGGGGDGDDGGGGGGGADDGGGGGADDSGDDGGSGGGGGGCFISNLIM